MAATAAAVVAAAAATAVAASSASAAESCECCPLAWHRRAGRGRDGEATRLPLIGADAPLVKCHLDGPRPFGGAYRIVIVKDMLLIGSGPGEAEQSVLLTGAKITSQGSVVVVSPRLTPPLTLHFASEPEAERWAAKLRDAAQATERAQAQSLRSAAEDPQRAQSARIAELEARVSATLHAAVDRSKRIKELEANIEEGKDRDLRIKELEEAVEETMQEASARGERIQELEAVLASRGGVPDAAASAVLEDAMRFAEQMLENRQEELAIDGGGAQGLQEAVEAVQRAKPAVDSEVAELVSKLVTALRWPLVLRRRLADAEATVKEQKEIHDNTLRELRDLQHQHAVSEDEKLQVEAEVVSLQRQLRIAERTAEEAVGRLEEIHNATGGDYPTLEDQQPLEEARRLQAEALSRELRDKLAAAEQAMEESVTRQKVSLDAAHSEELTSLQKKAEDIEVARQAAQAHAAELRELLVVAQRSADEAVAEQREALERSHAEDLRALQQLRAEADAQRDDAEGRAAELRRQLLAAEQAIDAEASRERDLLDQEHGEELTKLQRQQELARSQRDRAEHEANALKQRLEAAEQATRQAAEQATHRYAAMDKKREFAELQAIALKQRLADAEQAFDESMKSRKALPETTHSQELQELQEKHEIAQKERDQAEARAASLNEELTIARQASGLQAARQYEASDGARQYEALDAVKHRMYAAESQVAEVEMRASELQEKLINAEASLQDKASRQRDFLTASCTRAFAGSGQDARPPAVDARGSTDVLDEIKKEKAKMSELEQRLATSMAKAPSSWGGGLGAEGPGSRQTLQEDLDRRISTAERSVDAAAPRAAPRASERSVGRKPAPAEPAWAPAQAQAQAQVQGQQHFVPGSRLPSSQEPVGQRLRPGPRSALRTPASSAPGQQQHFAPGAAPGRPGASR